MRLSRSLLTAVVSLTLAGPVTASDPPAATPVAHEELGRTLDEMVGQLHGLGSRWREHFAVPEAGGERPLITIALSHRAELGLTPQQVDTLERLRAGFQREAIRRDADLRVAEMDLVSLRQSDPVDLAQVESKIREIERLRAELRIARVRTLEQGKAQLTAEQREKLRALVSEPRPMRPRAGTLPPGPPPPPGSPPPQRDRL
jgi:Spy/CpxP family protein refolding chaperone